MDGSSHYGSDREQLQLLVISQRNRLLELEQKREDTIIEMEEMKQTINTLSQTVSNSCHSNYWLSW